MKGYRIVSKLTREHVEKLYKRILRKRIITPAGCWELSYFKDAKGYYTIKFGGYNWRPNRISASYHFGTDINDSTILILHTCPNKSCWNPGHLKIGEHSSESNEGSKYIIKNLNKMFP